MEKKVIMVSVLGCQGKGRRCKVNETLRREVENVRNLGGGFWKEGKGKRERKKEI